MLRCPLRARCIPVRGDYARALRRQGGACGQTDAATGSCDKRDSVGEALPAFNVSHHPLFPA
jgi:hypothetical protein